jgi:nucleotidyltransferase/DNA polymerase involved in DNA repair
VHDPGILQLIDLARECSPRFEIVGDAAVVVDAAGLARLFGGPRAFGDHILEAASRRGLRVSVALAATRTTAMLLASAGDGVMVVPRGREAAAIAPLRLPVLARLLGETDAAFTVAVRRRRAALPGRHYRLAPQPGTNAAFDERGAVAAASSRAGVPPPQNLLPVLDRWGLRTIGDLAALPAADLLARLGADGVRWHRYARGEDDRPLLREPDEEPFEQAMALEWPIEGLEPLSFVLGRVLDPLCAQLERRDRGAAVLHVWLELVSRAVHHRSLNLPVPMRDPKVLRTLLLLDLEAHPPDAGIDAVVVAAEPAPGRVVQFSLLSRPLPSADQLSTLMARLTALMGEGRCGAPVLVDSHRPGAFGMVPFAPADVPGGAAPERGVALRSPACVLRRFRFTVPAQVSLERGRPARITTRHAGLAGGGVVRASGPWRSSGAWWSQRSEVGGGRLEVGGEGGRWAGRLEVRGARCEVEHGARDEERGPGAGQRQNQAPGVSPTKPWRSRVSPGSRPEVRGARCEDVAAGVASMPAAAGPWDHDEWDVALADRAVYRVHRDRVTSQWFVDGVWD